jgi:nitronate monooxygenase
LSDEAAVEVIGMALRTELTTRLNLRHPIVAAPLGRGSTPEFLAALADGGGIGFVALMHMAEPEVRQTLSRYITATGGGKRFGVNLVLIIDQMRRLDAALEAGCRIVSLLLGDPAPYVRRAKDAGAIIFWTVSGPGDAARAADLGVDFIVAQGREAGGHLLGEAPLMALLPAIVDAAQGVPVVAAGGLADGRGLAAVLALGACGAWMGTRFIASIESGNHQGHKQKIVEATFADIVETTLFDGGWPNSPHRVIRNSTLTRWEEAGCVSPGSRPGEGEQIGTFPEGMPLLRYNVSTPWEAMDGDWEAGPLYAGISAGLVQNVEPVADILSRTVAEAEAALLQAHLKTSVVLANPPI